MMAIRQKGDFAKLTTFLERAKKGIHLSTLDKYGKAGVEALRSATPRDTGLTAESWSYKIETMKNGNIRIGFYNSNIQNGVPIAIVIHYGHVTNGGGWVEGANYINKALEPVFKDLANAAWKEVSGS